MALRGLDPVIGKLQVVATSRKTVLGKAIGLVRFHFGCACSRQPQPHRFSQLPSELS